MVMGSRVVVTGAGGFVGSALCAELRRVGVPVLRVSRSGGDAIREINSGTDWSTVLREGDIVVHLAARAQVLDVTKATDVAAYREVNTSGTRRLAAAAAKAQVRRLVFLSSVRVLGTNTNGRAPFTKSDTPDPAEAYALSKYEAEEALQEISVSTGLEVCTIRPTLVYGERAAGNFARLINWVRHGIPIPFGAVRNARSMMALDNLVNLICVCSTHPNAAGQTFLASDGVSLSTPELVARIAYAMGRRPRLLSVPVPLLRLAGKGLGKSAEIDRLIGSLEVDITDTCRTLDWTPPIDMQEGLRRAIAE